VLTAVVASAVDEDPGQRWSIIVHHSSASSR